MGCVLTINNGYESSLWVESTVACMERGSIRKRKARVAGAERERKEVGALSLPLVLRARQ